MNPDRQTRRNDLADAAIAAAFYALSVMLILQLIDDVSTRAVAFAVALAHIAPLGFRRRWTIGALAAMAGAALISVFAGIPVVVLGPGVVVGAYTLGVRVDPRAAQPSLAGLIVVMTGVVLLNDGDGSTVASNAAVLILAWWLGDRSRRALVQAESERAAARQALRHAALDERMRIARELHDVVAHSMTVIAVQAGAARYAAPPGATAAVSALASIEETSRNALAEMRRLLAVLREDDAGVGELMPVPSLAEIDTLVDRARDAGVEVELRRVGQPHALPAGVELCAYRIVQEALTNVCKHARSRTARVQLAFGDDSLKLEIDDDGVGAANENGAAAGHGIVGMRERVALYGGSFEAGPRAEGGYRVVASFPVGAAK